MKEKKILVIGAFVALILVLAVTAVPKVNGESVDKLISNDENKKSESDSVALKMEDAKSLINNMLASTGDVPEDIDEELVWKIGDFLKDDYFNSDNEDRAYIVDFRENNEAFKTLCNKIEVKFEELDETLGPLREEFFYNNPDLDKIPYKEQQNFVDEILREVTPALEEIFNGEDFDNLLNDDEFKVIVADLASELEEHDIRSKDTSSSTNIGEPTFLRNVLTRFCTFLFKINFLLFGKCKITFKITEVFCSLVIFLPSVRLLWDELPIVAAIEGFLAVVALVVGFWIWAFQFLAQYGLFGILCWLILTVGLIVTSWLWIGIAILVGIAMGIASAIEQYDFQEHIGIIKDIIGEAADTAYEWWKQIWPWSDDDDSDDNKKSYVKFSVRFMEFIEWLLKRFFPSFLSEPLGINV